MPAYVVLHGYTGSPGSIERSSGVTPFALERGAVAVYPEGTPVPDQEGYAWASGTARFANEGVDDVVMLLEVLDVLVAQHCVDPTSILLSGESNGGAMVVRAACDPRTAGRIRLVAPVIPAIDAGVTAGCGSGGPVPLVAVASMNDDTIDYDGSYPSGEIPLDAQEVWFERTARSLNECTGSLVRSAITGGERIALTGCRATTELVAAPDGTHTWPGGPEGTGGLAPGSFATNTYLWEKAGFTS